jgi:hypothetical protein
VFANEQAAATAFKKNIFRGAPAPARANSVKRTRNVIVQRCAGAPPRDHLFLEIHRQLNQKNDVLSLLFEKPRCGNTARGQQNPVLRG